MAVRVRPRVARNSVTMPHPFLGDGLQLFAAWAVSSHTLHDLLRSRRGLRREQLRHVTLKHGMLDMLSCFIRAQDR